MLPFWLLLGRIISKELTLVIGLSFLFLMFLPPLKMGLDVWKKGPPPEQIGIKFGPFD